MNRRAFMASGAGVITSSSSRRNNIRAELLGRPQFRSKALLAVCNQLPTEASNVMLGKSTSQAVKPNSFRPLVLGRIPTRAYHLNQAKKGTLHEDQLH